jgi:hypothetical protein
MSGEDPRLYDVGVKPGETIGSALSWRSVLGGAAILPKKR